MKAMLVVDGNAWHYVRWDQIHHRVYCCTKAADKFALVHTHHREMGPAVLEDVAQLRQYPTEFTIVLDGIELNTTFMKSGRVMQGLIQRLPSLESLVLFKHSEAHGCADSPPGLLAKPEERADGHVKPLSMFANTWLTTHPAHR